MMERCTEAVAKWLAKRKVIEACEIKLYSYAIQSFILSLSPLLLAGVIGVSMGCVTKSMVVTVTFMTIRRYSGGFHSKSLISCLLYSSVLLLLCTFCADRIEAGWMVDLVTLLAAVSLGCFSPVESDNRVLELAERVRYKKNTIRTVVVLGIAFGILRECRSRYAVCVSVGIVLAALLQLPCVLKRDSYNRVI